MELATHQRQGGQLLVTNPDPKPVAAEVQRWVDPQARVGRGRPDQLDDYLVAFQPSPSARAATPNNS